MAWLPHDHDILSSDPSTTEKEATHSTLLHVYFIDPTLTICRSFLWLGFFLNTDILLRLEDDFYFFKCLELVKKTHTTFDVRHYGIQGYWVKMSLLGIVCNHTGLVRLQKRCGEAFHDLRFRVPYSWLFFVLYLSQVCLQCLCMSPIQELTSSAICLSRHL
jgi:hypothetical protein